MTPYAQRQGSERAREREREERGAGRRQAKRARACRCSPSARVWRSCVPSACPAPRRVKRLLVPCAFMLRHGKKATFPRRAGTRRTLSVCGVPCSGARARGVDCGLWTRIPRDRAGPAGCACTGRWSRVASASAAARTPYACAQHRLARCLHWLPLGTDRIVCTQHMSLPGVFLPLPSVSSSLQHMETQEKSQMSFYHIHVHTVGAIFQHVGPGFISQ